MKCSLASHEQHGNAEKINKNWGNSYPYYPSEDEVNEAANLSVSGIREKPRLLSKMSIIGLGSQLHGFSLGTRIIIKAEIQNEIQNNESLVSGNLMAVENMRLRDIDVNKVNAI